MNIKSISALIAMSLLAAGCASMKVTSDKADGYDFSSAKTYRWIPGPEDILNEKDTFINEDIQRALDDGLQKAGLENTETTADMHVAYYLKLKEQLEYTDTGTHTDRDFTGGFVYNRDSSNWSYQEREPDLNVYAVEIGTLTLLAYDAKTGQRIWRGTLRTKLDRSRPEEEQQALIAAVAEKLMEHFPIQSR